MPSFLGSGVIRYVLLGFGALLVGMQIGYTVHYTSSAGGDSSAGHREAYEYLVSLHDLLDEGLINDAEFRALVAKHRTEIAVVSASPPSAVSVVANRLQAVPSQQGGPSRVGVRVVCFSQCRFVG